MKDGKHEEKQPAVHKAGPSIPPCSCNEEDRTLSTTSDSEGETISVTALGTPEASISEAQRFHASKDSPSSL